MNRKYHWAMWLACLFASVGVANAQVNSDLQIEGSVGFSQSGPQVLLTADRICNRSTSRLSGTVHIGLFATSSAEPRQRGHVLAEVGLRGNGDTGQLPSNICFTSIRYTTEWIRPPDGVYFVHFYVTEHPYTGEQDNLRLLDTVTFDELLTVGNPPPPPPPPPSGDDHGNSLSTATPLSLGFVGAPVRMAGRLETAGDADYFRFVVTTRSEVRLRTESAIDTTGVLYDSTGSILLSNDDSNGLDFALTATLEPGTYFVAVRGFEGTVGAYTLAAEAGESSPLPPPSNTPPVASFTATPSSGQAPLQVTLDAFQSSDPDGILVSFRWDFGDGSGGAEGIGVTHTYSVPGSYVATLTVTDDSGATASTTRQITVSGSGSVGGRSGGGGGGGGGALGLATLLFWGALGAAAMFRSRRRLEKT